MTQETDQETKKSLNRMAGVIIRTRRRAHQIQLRNAHLKTGQNSKCGG
jgi:hypothetical protein